MTISPLYTADKCGIAYQLNWSLSVFSTCELPEESTWLAPLKTLWEADGVRALEYRRSPNGAVQFLLSTQPTLAPSEAIRVVKGRLQHFFRTRVPRLWKRNYRIDSVGETSSQSLQHYVARQPQRHPMADARTQGLFENLQWCDERINLQQVRASGHGQFVYNLHLVLETADHLADVCAERILTTREMIVRVCQKKSWMLSRIGVAHHHLHLLLGCDVAETPSEVALSLLNNIAYAHDMRPVLEHSFYVGTFGRYDRNAIRRALPKSNAGFSEGDTSAFHPNE
jgi:REP element-mobilizing transposase RayT